MASRPLVRALMTSAAIASLSTVAMAEGWSTYVVFGDRQQDSGQYISRQGAFGNIGGRFASAQQGVGDGRYRDTNPLNVRESIRDQVYTQMLGEELGLGSVDPSQPMEIPQENHDDPIPQASDGLNYASIYYHSADVLESIIGTANMVDIAYDDDAGILVDFEARSRPGLLNDPDRQGVVDGALVVLGGGGEDIRGLADLRMTDGANREPISLFRSRVEFDAAQRSLEAWQAAENIATGAEALVDAGSGLLIVMNQFDLGETPERIVDLARVSSTGTRVRARVADARASAVNAQVAEQSRLNRIAEAEAARVVVAEREVLLEEALDRDTATEATIEFLTENLEAARLEVIEADNAVEIARLFAIERAQNAENLALRDEEVRFIGEYYELELDPSVMATFRTEATTEFNAELLARLREIDGNIILIDQHTLIKAAIANPAAFGLDPDADHANTCLFNVPNQPCTPTAADEAEALFGTNTGLGTGGQKIISDYIAALVSAPAAFARLPGVGISSGRGVSDAARDQLSREQTTTPGLAPFIAGTVSRVKLSDTTGFPQQDASYTSGIAGLKYVLSDGIAVGAAAGYQQVNSPNNDNAFEYDGSALVGTVFAGVNTGPFFGSATATLGKIDYDDLTRVTTLNGGEFRNSGSTEGTVSGVTAEAGLRLLQYDILRAGPVANFSHWNSKVDGYAERGWSATAVRSEDTEVTSTRAGVGVFLEAGNFHDGQGAMFRAKALYGHEFGDGGTGSASVTPLSEYSLGSFSTSAPGADEASLEFGAEVVFGFGGIYTTLGYDGLYGDVTDHRFRIGASMPLGG